LCGRHVDRQLAAVGDDQSGKFVSGDLCLLLQLHTCTHSNNASSQRCHNENCADEMFAAWTRSVYLSLVFVGHALCLGHALRLGHTYRACKHRLNGRLCHQYLHSMFDRCGMSGADDLSACPDQYRSDHWFLDMRILPSNAHSVTLRQFGLRILRSTCIVRPDASVCDKMYRGMPLQC
jgi:hypothetical protein